MNDLTPRRKTRGRALLCGALLVLLAACSYMGAGAQHGAQMVSLPVVRTTMEQEKESQYVGAAGGLQAVRARLEESRREELRLLDEAAASGADAQTVSYAASQRADIALRMENEALVYAALGALGIGDCAVCCGAGMLTIFLPGQTQAMQDGGVQLIDAASEQTGIAADSIKIILVKNET